MPPLKNAKRTSINIIPATPHCEITPITKIRGIPTHKKIAIAYITKDIVIKAPLPTALIAGLR